MKKKKKKKKKEVVDIFNAIHNYRNDDELTKLNKILYVHTLHRYTIIL